MLVACGSQPVFLRFVSRFQHSVPGSELPSSGSQSHSSEAWVQDVEEPAEAGAKGPGPGTHVPQAVTGPGRAGDLKRGFCSCQARCGVLQILVQRFEHAI